MFILGAIVGWFAHVVFEEWLREEPPVRRRFDDEADAAVADCNCYAGECTPSKSNCQRLQESHANGSRSQR